MNNHSKQRAMVISYVKLPKKLRGNVDVFVRNLFNLPKFSQLELDFSNLTDDFNPFAILYLAEYLKKFRKSRKDSLFHAIGINKSPLLQQIRFFEAAAVKPQTDVPIAKNAYIIPISVFKTANVRKEAAELLMHPSELLQEKASELASLLSRGSNYENVQKVLTYCIRELFRNVLEHSGADEFSICGKVDLENKHIAIAIMDNGIGIYNSLKSNKDIAGLNESNFLKLAISAGVSANLRGGKKLSDQSAWANSGFGLTMISEICTKAGSFVLASSNRRLIKYSVNSAESKIEEKLFKIDGTLISLTIVMDRLQDLDVMLQEVRSRNPDKAISPASLSLNVGRDVFWKK